MRYAGVAAIVGLVAACAAAAVIAFERASPPPLPNTLTVQPPVYPVESAGVVSYVIAPADQPIVLVNSGNEASAASIVAKLEELGRTTKQVRAILLNHGSYDHWAGLEAFPKATVYAASDDLGLVAHARRIDSGIPRMQMRLLGRPARPRAALRTAVPSGLITIGSLKFDCIPLPGVTKGTMAYKWNDFLFVGDTLWRKDNNLSLPPSPWLELKGTESTVLGRIDAHPTRWLATSRHGLLSRAPP